MVPMAAAAPVAQVTSDLILSRKRNHKVVFKFLSVTVITVDINATLPSPLPTRWKKRKR